MAADLAAVQLEYVAIDVGALPEGLLPCRDEWDGDDEEYEVDVACRVRTSVRVRDAFDVSTEGRFRAHCPACPAIDSLIVDTVPDARGILTKCLAGCPAAKLARAIEKLVRDAEAELAQRIERERLEEMRRQVSLSEAFDSVCAPEPQLIESVLPADSLIMVSGPSGARKTITATSWSVAVAGGFPWLDLPVRKVPVLMVLLEGSRVEHLRWIRQLARGAGLSVDQLALSLYRDDLKVDNPKSLRAFCDYVRCLGCRLVIIDNLTQIHDGGPTSENDARFMARVLHPLETLVRTTPGLTVVVLHHSNASGDPRGRDGIKQHFDRTWTIDASSDQNSAVIKLERGKARDGREAVNLRWRYVGGPDDAAITLSPVGLPPALSPTQPKEEPRRKKLLELLPADAAGIYDGIGGNRNAVKRLRDALEAEGAIVLRDGVWRIASSH